MHYGICEMGILKCHLSLTYRDLNKMAAICPPFCSSLSFPITTVSGAKRFGVTLVTASPWLRFLLTARTRLERKLERDIFSWYILPRRVNPSEEHTKSDGECKLQNSAIILPVPIMAFVFCKCYLEVRNDFANGCYKFPLTAFQFHSDCIFKLDAYDLKLGLNLRRGTDNSANPVCCVAIVCHQVCCMVRGHLGHFHRTISHLNW